MTTLAELERRLNQALADYIHGCALFEQAGGEVFVPGPAYRTSGGVHEWEAVVSSVGPRTPYVIVQGLKPAHATALAARIAEMLNDESKSD